MWPLPTLHPKQWLVRESWKSLGVHRGVSELICSCGMFPLLWGVCKTYHFAQVWWVHQSSWNGEMCFEPRWWRPRLLYLRRTGINHRVQSTTRNFTINSDDHELGGGHTKGIGFRVEALGRQNEVIRWSWMVITRLAISVSLWSFKATWKWPCQKREAKKTETAFKHVFFLLARRHWV